MGRTYRARKGRFGVTFESVGDETSGVFESHFLAFLQGVFPKIILRSVDITACVPRREPQYSFLRFVMRIILFIVSRVVRFGDRFKDMFALEIVRFENRFEHCSFEGRFENRFEDCFGGLFLDCSFEDRFRVCSEGCSEDRPSRSVLSRMVSSICSLQGLFALRIALRIRDVPNTR